MRSDRTTLSTLSWEFPPSKSVQLSARTSLQKPSPILDRRARRTTTPASYSAPASRDDPARIAPPGQVRGNAHAASSIQARLTTQTLSIFWEVFGTSTHVKSIARTTICAQSTPSTTARTQCSPTSASSSPVLDSKHQLLLARIASQELLSATSTNPVKLLYSPTAR